MNSKRTMQTWLHTSWGCEHDNSPNVQCPCSRSASHRKVVTSANTHNFGDKEFTAVWTCCLTLTMQHLRNHCTALSEHPGLFQNYLLQYKPPKIRDAHACLLNQNCTLTNFLIIIIIHYQPHCTLNIAQFMFCSKLKKGDWQSRWQAEGSVKYCLPLCSWKWLTTCTRDLWLGVSSWMDGNTSGLPASPSSTILLAPST